MVNGLGGVLTALRMPRRKQSSAPGTSQIASFLGDFYMTSDEWHEQLRGHATAIGFVSIKWAWLELVIDCFIGHLSGLAVGSIECSTMVANMDFSDKIKVARALAHHKRLSDAWQAEVDNILNKIDNQVRPQRNRITHDVWNPPKSEDKHPTRTHSRTKLGRLQSRRDLVLTTHAIVEMSETAISSIADEITTATTQLVELASMIPDWPSNTEDMTS